MGSTEFGPYRQTYNYDAFSNMTLRTGRLWAGTEDAYATTYVNDRNQAWSYNEAGLPNAQETMTSSYNSAGLRQDTVSPNRRIGTQVVNLTLDQRYDGDGQLIKTTSSFGSTTTYNIRSSVLGGQVIADITGSGTRKVGYVYANAQLIARQTQFSGVQWEHRDPMNTRARLTSSTGASLGGAEYDPTHSSVGLEDPGSGGDGTFADMLYPRSGDPTDLSGGCMVDFLAVPCSLAMSVVNMEAGVATDPYATPSGVTAIIWTSGPNKGETGFAVFHAYADGHSGFVPTNGRYGGDGRVQVYTVTDRELREDKHGTLEILYWGWIEGAGLPQNSVPKGDCATFANMVEQIANATLGSRLDTPGLDVRLFMNRLATTFTEFPAATFSAVTGLAELEGLRGGTPPRFGSSGFASSYFETGGNQVRHAVGGLIAGYVGIPLHDPIAGIGMNDREDPNDRQHGVPDINLNNQTVPMGARIASDNVGSMFGRNLPPRGAAAAKGLANWIRSTLCVQ